MVHSSSDQRPDHILAFGEAYEALCRRMGCRPVLVLSQPRNRKGLEAKGRTDGLGPSLRKSVWVIVIWRLPEY